MNTPVSFKLAKLLKEKKFGLTEEDYIQLPRWFDNKGEYFENIVSLNKKINNSPNHLGADTINDFEAKLVYMDNSLLEVYLAPTIAEVVMWCFNKYKYSIEYSMNIPESGEYDGCYVFNGLIKGSEDYKLKIFYTSKDYPTAEKALEDTINHFLINFF